MKLKDVNLRDNEVLHIGYFNHAGEEYLIDNAQYQSVKGWGFENIKETNPEINIYPIDDGYESAFIRKIRIQRNLKNDLLRKCQEYPTKTVKYLREQLLHEYKEKNIIKDYAYRNSKAKQKTDMSFHFGNNVNCDSLYIVTLPEEC